MQPNIRGINTHPHPGRIIRDSQTSFIFLVKFGLAQQYDISPPPRKMKLTFQNLLQNQVHIIVSIKGPKLVQNLQYQSSCKFKCLLSEFIPSQICKVFSSIEFVITLKFMYSEKATKFCEIVWPSQNMYLYELYLSGDTK